MRYPVIYLAVTLSTVFSAASCTNISQGGTGNSICANHSNCGARVSAEAPSNPIGVSGMSGGCKPFEAIAQNSYPPYGAAIRAQPNAQSTQITSYAGNKPISVNGWVYGTAEYPTNPPPWNSNIWFHLTDGTGWVSLAAVRAYPMTQDPNGLNPDGGPPVATSKACEGAVQ